MLWKMGLDMLGPEMRDLLQFRHHFDVGNDDEQRDFRAIQFSDTPRCNFPTCVDHSLDALNAGLLRRQQDVRSATMEGTRPKLVC
jgi:hypothetical protein